MSDITCDESLILAGGTEICNKLNLQKEALFIRMKFIISYKILNDDINLISYMIYYISCE